LRSPGRPGSTPRAIVGAPRRRAAGHE